MKLSVGQDVIFAVGARKLAEVKSLNFKISSAGFESCFAKPVLNQFHARSDYPCPRKKVLRPSTIAIMDPWHRLIQKWDLTTWKLHHSF